MKTNPKKTLHVTFGYSGRAVLEQSGFVDTSEGEIIGFDDDLSIGPLCDTDDAEDIGRRKRWLDEVFEPTVPGSEFNGVEDDLIRLKHLASTARDYKCIYLWLGDEAVEMMLTARVLYRLQGVDTTVYKLNFSKADFRNADGQKLDLTSLQLMHIEHVPEASRHFEKLDGERRQWYASLWERLLVDDSLIRVFDKYGNYHPADETYFDRFLIDRCTDRPQDSTHVVAYTLFDIWEEYGYGNIGDSYLYHRLNHLGKTGKVEITGRHEDKLRSRRLFKVRRAEGIL